MESFPEIGTARTQVLPLLEKQTSFGKAESHLTREVALKETSACRRGTRGYGGPDPKEWQQARKKEYDRIPPCPEVQVHGPTVARRENRGCRTARKDGASRKREQRAIVRGVRDLPRTS